MEKILKICNRIIEYSFYGLFFLVPLYFSGDTFELFEFNKMWLVFGLTILITTSWIIKMIINKEVRIQRTPLDLPILLFLLFQGIATIHSLDQHVSLWGYYSRFNGGFLSTLSYVLLYYAFVSNLLTEKPKQETKPEKQKSLIYLASGFAAMLIGFIFSLAFSAPDSVSEFFKATLATIGVFIGFFLFIKALPLANKTLKVIFLSLISGAVVALWGLPSHWGYDPTCLQFRGTFDVACWTDAFQPRVRIFSMLGQPNWLAGYLAILLPLVLALFLNVKIKLPNILANNKNKLIHASCYALLAILFFTDIIFTNSQSGFIAIAVALVTFAVLFLFIIKKHFPQTEKRQELKSLAIIFILLFLTFFFAGSPIEKLRPLTLPGIMNKLLTQRPTPASAQKQPTGPALEAGITSSGKIRSIVWKGAIDIWKNNPLIGTGVETFAYAYYQYRPTEHNQTSEWDYLYNKAHNEYLNYLATTGALGLGTYLLMIGWFLYLCIKYLMKNGPPAGGWKIIIIGLLSGYISILVINFFGFSVVLLNLFLFLIPAFFLCLSNTIDPTDAVILPQSASKKSAIKSEPIGMFSQMSIVIVILIGLTLLFQLYQFREADKAYALGNNYDKVNQFTTATPYLRRAVDLRPGEPVFQDELSINLAAISVLDAYQKNATAAAESAKEAMTISNSIITNYPNNVVFWKTRVRLFYTLAQLNPDYNRFALQAIEQAHKLAPTDAKILYNLGVLQGQTGNPKQAIITLQKTVAYKPDYRDAYFAMALFYRDLAIDKKGTVINPEMEQKAVETMRFILTNFNKNDKQVLDILKTWGEN